MDADAAKRAVGCAAADLVTDGMCVGLGTGSTARWFIEALAERLRLGLTCTGVATSQASARLAADLGIPLTELGAGGLDLAVDGADAVDEAGRLLKGAGGALVRERIVAAAARRFVVLVDPGKCRDPLGGPVAVELLPFGAVHTLAVLGPEFTLRRAQDGPPMHSDNGNLLADAQMSAIDDPEALARRIDAIPGVIGHGIFLGLATEVLIGHPDGLVQRRVIGANAPIA